MVELALQPAKTIIEALSWTERFGGIAREVRIPIPDGEGTVNKIFPVRKDLAANECFKQHRYTELVPNSQYQNLLYFEPLSDFSQQKGASRRDLKFSGRVRLVYWLNLQKMGEAEDGSHLIAGQAAAQLVASLDKNLQMTSPFPARITYSEFTIISSDKKIFDRYSYDQNVDALMFYPFDFGAIDFRVTCEFGKSCLQTIGGVEIDCIEWN